MMKFMRFLYVLVVELVLLPLQIVALAAFWVYLVIAHKIKFGKFNVIGLAKAYKQGFELAVHQFVEFIKNGVVEEKEVEVNF